VEEMVVRQVPMARRVHARGNGHGVGGGAT